MRTDKAGRLKLLCDLISQTIETDGQEANGFIWAVRSRQDWASLMGVEPRTIAALITLPPIVRLSTMAEDGGQPRRAVALRIGQPGEVAKPLTADQSAATLAKEMGKLFRAKTGKAVTPKEFGMLRGLAGVWPDGWQVQVFRFALSDWPSTMAAVKLAEALLHDDPDHQGRFYRFPSISVMRRFASTVADAFLTDHQTKVNGAVPFQYAAE